MTESPSYDVAVIGGGIAGAAIADEAASRGLRILLLEKDEFGSGTSSRSSKLIHGGLRYLELAGRDLLRCHFSQSWKNLSFVFSSIHESRILQKTKPDLVHPHSILLPIYRSSPRRRWLIFLGTALYGTMAFLSGSRRFPRFLLSAKETLQKVPSLRQEGLLGGVVLWENLTDDKSLVHQTVQSAARKGAQTLHHAPVLRYEHDSAEKIYRITAKVEGSEKVFQAKRLVNATGPWIDQTRQMASPITDSFVLPIAGAHIELKQFTPCSCLLQAQDHRFFFVINTGTVSRVGTTEREWNDPDHVQPTEEEVAYLLESLRYYFPSLDFKKEHILRSDAGVRPLVRPSRESKANQVSREHAIFQTADGVLHVVGVKLTDHRRAAREVAARLIC